MKKTTEGEKNPPRSLHETRSSVSLRKTHENSRDDNTGRCLNEHPSARSGSLARHRPSSMVHPIKQNRVRHAHPSIHPSRSHAPRSRAHTYILFTYILSKRVKSYNGSGIVARTRHTGRLASHRHRDRHTLSTRSCSFLRSRRATTHSLARRLRVGRRLTDPSIHTAGVQAGGEETHAPREASSCSGHRRLRLQRSVSPCPSPAA